MRNLLDRSQTLFILVIMVFLLNTIAGNTILTEPLVDLINVSMMAVFVVMMLLFSPHILGHQAYDHMDDLYSQTEGERIYTLSRDGPGG